VSQISAQPFTMGGAETAPRDGRAGIKSESSDSDPLPSGWWIVPVVAFGLWAWIKIIGALL